MGTSLLNRTRASILETLEGRVLLSATDLDLSFSGNGLVSSALNGGYNNARTVAVQSDGKIIVVGQAKISATKSTYGFAAIRYNSDGTLDDGSTSDSTPGDRFGTDGQFHFGQGTSADATSIAIQRDGKIVIAGTANAGGSVPQQYWLLVRLNANGTLDKTFGDNGVSGMEFSIDNTPLNAIALQADGKIVAVGSESGNFLVGRFTISGELDDNFADFGTSRTDFGGTDSASDVTIDGIGNIIVVGGVAGNGVNQNMGITRLLPDGTPDPNFATNGKGIFDTGLHRLDVIGAVITSDGETQVAESRYDSDGGWDGTIHSIALDGSGSAEHGVQGQRYSDIVLMPNGRYAVSGTDTTALGAGKFFVDLDGAGDVTSRVGFTTASATAIAAAPDGGIIVAGSGDVTGGRNFAVAKYLGVSPSTWGAITGTIFRDLDGDGVQDPNEPGSGNVRVFIDFNNNDVWEPFTSGFRNEPSALTDSNGNYAIKDERSTTAVVVREVVPGNTTQTVPAASFYSVKPVLGKSVKAINFVNTLNITPSTKTQINGSVFNDYNNDGSRQTSSTVEPDMAGVVVYLDANKNRKFDTGEVSTKTDVSGNYSLNIAAAGHYRIAVAPPMGFTNTSVRFLDLTVHSHTQSIARFAIAPADADDSIAEVTNLAVTKTGAAVTGTIGSSTDVNFYRFTVKAGQTISFDLDLGSGSSLDSYLRLFNASGTQLSTNDNGIAAGESTSLDSYIKYKFSKAGTYYIAVSDHLNRSYNPTTGTGDTGGGTKGKYTLNFHASK